jgi:uncharacterized protein (UPF0147 family)
MNRPTPSPTSSRPIAVLGAGELVSHVHRVGDVIGDANYEFNAFRIGKDMKATHKLRPTDLRNVVKLCQVLAFAIADDGWLPNSTRTELFELANELDEITQKWSDEVDG